MITHIFGNPTDANYATKYAEHITSIRRLGSPDIVSVFDETDLPTALIEDTAYLGSAELQLLTDIKMTASQVNSIISSDSVKTLNLQYLLILGTVLKMLPQLIQITSEKAGITTTAYQNIDWVKKETYLRNEYSLTIINITPDTNVTDEGVININVAQTSSRVND